MPKSPLSPPAVIVTVALAVCLGAAAPPLNFERERGGPEGPEGPAGPGGPGGMNVFISPSGQPFRAPPGAPYPSAVWFAAADADHDGKLTLAEFRADAVAFFDSLDKNKDGVVDGFENQDYEHSVPEMAPRVRSLMPGEGMDMSLGRRDGRGGRMDRGGGGGRQRSGRGAVGGREGAAMFSYFFDPQPVSAADSDFSSKITLKEWEILAGRRFAMLDTTNVGYLALATLPKTPVQTVMEKRKDDDRRRDRRRPER